MESKIKTASGNIYEKWQNYEKQTGIQYLLTINKDTGKQDRKWRFRFRFRGKLYSEVIGLESRHLTEKKVLEIWGIYAANRTLGQEPFSPGGAVEIQEAAREEAAREAAAARSMTLASLFDEAMQLREVSAKEGHRRAYRQLFRDWIEPVIGELPIHELKSVHIAQVLKNMAGGSIPRVLNDDEKKYYRERPRSAQTQEHAWNAIRIIWTYARDNKIVTGAYPGAKIKPKVANERHAYLTEEQATAVLNDLRGSGKRGTGGRRGSVDAWGQALLSLHCGLRAGEILDLTWRNVDIKNRIGIVTDTKNKGLSRKFYISPQVAEMFAERLEISPFTKPGDYIFPSRKGERVGEMGDVFTRCFKRLGINKGDEDSRSKIVFHSFRHTFATWLAQKGVPMSVIAELMGHDVTKTTERYIQYAPKTMIKDAISFFASLNQGSIESASGDEREVIDVTPTLPQ